MQLHDAVGINYKEGATTGNQGAGVKYMGLGEYMLCDCVCGICLDITTSHWWKEKVVVYSYSSYYIIIINIHPGSMVRT